MRFEFALVGLWILAVFFIVVLLFTFNSQEPSECRQFVTRLSSKDEGLEISEEIVLNEKFKHTTLSRMPLPKDPAVQILKAFTYQPHSFMKMEIESNVSSQPMEFKLPILANTVAKLELTVTKTSKLEYCLKDCKGIDSFRLDLIGLDLISFDADFDKNQATLEDVFAWNKASVINKKVLIPSLRLNCLTLTFDSTE